MELKLLRQLDCIAGSIREAGFEPFDQITGYLRTGDDRYITRTGNAREQIKQFDRRILKEYCAFLKTKK